MKTFTVILILCSVLQAGEIIAQSHENFGILWYVPPQSWTRESGNGFVSFTTVERGMSQYARILLYAAHPSSGNLNKDFADDWNELVRPHYQPGDFIQQSESPFRDGWMAKTGVARFSYGNQNQAVILVTLSDNRTRLSYVFISNTTAYQKEFEDFGSSLRFSQPDATTIAGEPAIHASSASRENSIIQPSDAGAEENQSVAAVSASGHTAGIHGISVFPTRFDDGWVSIPETDWVKVSKGEVTVLLHHGMDFNDAMRASPVEVNWNALAAGRYHSVQRLNYNYSALNFPFYYTEADATEALSGKKVFVGFRVIPVSGVAYVVEIQSPSKEIYQQHFPTVESIETMRYYNRFAIHPGDLNGNWSSFSSSSIMLYNVYTGINAGMNYASINDEFTFNPGGTYKSRHVGASSSYGTTSHFNDQFSGRHIVNHWDIALTNRKEGRTDTYHAFFEAVKGGSILHLTHKQFSGLTFKLFKVK